MINSNTPIVTAKNGRDSLTVSSNFTPATGLVTNKVIPNGGVASPTTRLTQNTTPICSGLIPRAHAIGPIIGASMTVDA